MNLFVYVDAIIMIFYFCSVDICLWRFFLNTRRKYLPWLPYECSLRVSLFPCESASKSPERDCEWKCLQAFVYLCYIRYDALLLLSLLDSRLRSTTLPPKYNFPPPLSDLTCLASCEIL